MHCISFLTEGLQGHSEHYFVTNLPPRDGTCFISPKEGRVLETFFYIECPGWKDEDGPLVYKIFRGKKLLQHGKDAILSPSLLPLGPPQNNYSYNLTVKIFDQYNSFSAETLLVTVSGLLFITMKPIYSLNNSQHEYLASTSFNRFLYI